MIYTPRSMSLTAFSFVIGVFLLYNGISLLRDPQAINRGIFGWWGRMLVRILGPEMERVNRLSAKPGAIFFTIFGIYFLVVAILAFFIPNW